MSVKRRRSPSSPKTSMGNADALGYRWANESFRLVEQEQTESDQADWPIRDVVRQERWPNGALNVWIDLVHSDGRKVKEKKTKKKKAHATPVDEEATLRRMQMMAERDAVRIRTPRNQPVATVQPTPTVARSIISRRTPAAISTEEAASRAARERQLKERAEAARALLANQRAEAAATFFATLAEFEEWNMRYRTLKPVKNTASDEDTWSDEDANDALALYFAEKTAAKGDAVDGPATEQTTPTTEELQQMRISSDYLLALTADMFERYYDDRI